MAAMDEDVVLMMGTILLLMVMPRQGLVIVSELFSWWRGSAEGWSTQEIIWEGGREKNGKIIWEGGKEKWENGKE